MVEREDGSYLVSGAASADLLTDRLGLNLPADRDYSTVAGFALSVLKHIPVLVLTARGQQHDRQLALELKADSFVTKPYSNEEVLREVRRLLGNT